jgi:hypothetical protein
MSHDVQKTITTWYVDPDAEDRMSDGHAPIWRHLIDLMVERDQFDGVVSKYPLRTFGHPKVEEIFPPSYPVISAAGFITAA